MNSTETTERTGPMDQRRECDEDTMDTARLVPIGESIRYRRRAQNAEKQAQDLADQLTQANETIARMSEDLEGLQRDQELTRKLSTAGGSRPGGGAVGGQGAVEERRRSGSRHVCRATQERQAVFVSSFLRDAGVTTDRRREGSFDSGSNGTATGRHEGGTVRASRRSAALSAAAKEPGLIVDFGLGMVNSERSAGPNDQRST